MNYLLHAGLLLAACFLYYWLLLRSETHFRLNRWVLLACLAGSLTLPLITMPAAWSLKEVLVLEAKEAPEAVAPTAEMVPAPESSAVPPELVSGPKALSVEPATVPVASTVPPINWLKILRWVYLAGVLVFGLNFLVQLGQLLFRMIRYPGHDLGGFRLVEMREDDAPYSFWNRIFLNPDRYDPDTFHQIVQHEQIHVRQKHSIDLLLAELVVILQWFNPFAWFYRSAIEHNLEFLTDAEMLRIGNDPESYQLSLVKVAVPNFPNGLVASYNQKFLEKRITMMKSKKSSARSGWKYLTILPLLFFSMLQFNAVAQSPVPPVSPASPAPAPLIVVTTPVLPQPAAPLAEVDASGLAIPAPAVAPVSLPAPVTVPAPAAPVISTDINVKIDMPEGMENSLNSWTALIEGQDICFNFMSRSNAYDNRYQWNSSRCFDLAELGNLPRNAMGVFTIKRTSGTMTLKGIFEENDGVGNFSFEEDPAFVNMLEKEGFGSYQEREMLLFFMADMSEEYVRYIKSVGYEPGHEDLLKLAIFYEDQQEFDERLTSMKRLGYGQPGFDKMIELEIHGVSEGLAKALAQAGFKDLSLQELIEAMIHGVSPNQVIGFRNMGYEDLRVQDLVNARIHGVSPEFAASFREVGFKDIPMKTLVNLRIHGVSADFIKARRDKGETLQDFISMKIHRR